ncbi:hypothetical protein ACFWSF_23435 [Streptomyces sp. NPDC058611]|uniref:hypothetical protein n=1 Tax=unclassified Streptomyces TaxID=2593676 RepID=UPI00364A3526
MRTRDDGASASTPTEPLTASAVTTRAERQRASGYWLLPAAPTMAQGFAAWRDDGVAWLRPGVLFGAVSIPASLVHAAVGVSSPEECAAPLAEALQGGPLFYEPDHDGPDAAYTALVPASTGLQWRVHPSVAHPYRALLLVPAPERCEPGNEPALPWWVVPVDRPGLLCPPDRLTALVGLGRDASAGKAGA